jgi:hypothetical protein
MRMTRISGPAARVLTAMLAFVVVGLVSGCATITGSETQNVSVQALDSSGAAVAEAECKLSNDKGNWRAKPPTIAVVTRSAEDLMVQCDADGQQPGTVRAVSRANAGMVGNIIFGGAIGAVIDHSKGTAYDYPSLLRVIFGTAQVIDKASEPGNAPAMPSTPPALPPTASPPLAENSPRRAEGAERTTGNQPVSLDDLKDLLPK